MGKILGYLVVITLLTTTLSAAENQRDGGPYIGAGYGVATYNDNNFYNDVKEKNIGSYNLYAGAYINKYFSVELDYLKSGDFHVVDITSVQTTFNYSAITVDALAHYPILDDSVDFFAKFGAGQSYISISTNDGAALVYGAGVSYRFNDTFALRMAYDMYQFTYNSDARGKFNMNLQCAYAAIEVQF